MAKTIHFFFLVTAFMAISNAHNITEILFQFPEYAQFNNLLTETKLADEINSRNTITVLVLTDIALSPINTVNHPLSVIKDAISLHVLLDYWDANKLHQISQGSTLSTTLYQTTGKSAGSSGIVNITVLSGSKVAFGSALPGSLLDSFFIKPVKPIPYNISVIEISNPIIVPGILDSPDPVANVNITNTVERAGCKTFAALLVSTGVIQTYQAMMENGLTVFAPSDEAFEDEKLPDLKKLSNSELVLLLQYHAVADYTPMGTLKMANHPISTLSKFDLSATTDGGAVALDTGVGLARVASTVVDSTPLCIFTVDSVLLPAELFGIAPSPAPVLSPEISPSPAVSVAPSLAPVVAASPTPSPLSSPDLAPTLAPVLAPTSSPAVSPANSQSSMADKNAGDVNSPALIKTILTGAVLVFAFVGLS